MERQIMINHRNSKELTDLLTQLKEHDVRQVGSVERTDNWRSLADSGLNKAPMDNKNYSYGIVISTLPNIDFHTTKLSRKARVSRCYEYHGKNKDNVIEGQEYYDFIQDLSSKISLPKCWRFMFPKYMGFAMYDSLPGSTSSYYGGRGEFELCESLSLAESDPDKEKIKSGVCGGVLGKGSHFGKVPSSWSGYKWQHLRSGTILFPTYCPAIVGRMYHEGEIKTKREFIDSDEGPKDTQKSSININCLEVIAIYPDKKVLEGAIPIGSGLVKAFLTYHPDYQFKWSESAEIHALHAFIEDRKIRQGKIEYGSPPIEVIGDPLKDFLKGKIDFEG